MKKFLSRVIVIIAITLIADRVLSYVTGIFYKTTTTTDEYKINEVTYHMTAPVIFMGSSMSHHNYVPSIISDTLKTDVYNAGLWGMRNIYFQYGLLSNILKRYTPKTIFLELHPIDFLQTPFSTVETVSRLTPFINYSEGCDEVLKKGKLYYKCKASNLYRYNSEFANIVVGNITNLTPAALKGFKPLIGQLTDVNVKPEQFPYAVDKDKIHYIQAFIDMCKKKKITLVFLTSPMYAIEQNTTLFNVPDSLAKQNKIAYINNYNLSGITGHREYYYDFGHLNEEGAKKYSSFIAPELKQFVD
jgi:hypothetical protein